MNPSILKQDSEPLYLATLENEDDYPESYFHLQTIPPDLTTLMDDEFEFLLDDSPSGKFYKNQDFLSQQKNISATSENKPNYVPTHPTITILIDPVSVKPHI